MVASSSPYQPAAAILNKVWDHRVPFKTAVYRGDQLICSKTTYAQVCRVLAHAVVLERVLASVPPLNVHNQGLLYVLLYELLLGPHQSIQGGGAVKRKLLQHETQLRTALVEAQKDISSTAAVATFPRYVRVNTLQTSTAEVVERLRRSLPDLPIYGDAHVPDLLVCPPGSTNQLREQNIDGLVWQDKSSCLPALCLVHGFDSCGGDVLDACAAPGNKTSHVAALLDQVTAAKNDVKAAAVNKKKKQHKTTVTVYALDRSKERFQVLKRRLHELVPPKKQVRVVTQCQDFLETSGQDFPTVRAILLDPTCSGSGIYTATMGHHQEEKDNLDNLVGFQIKALVHALSAFPAVDRVVYSTCSVNVPENEGVVARALQQVREKEQEHSTWEIVSPACLTPDCWKRRGRPLNAENDGAGGTLSSEEVSSMIRADRDDETNGFFVCCLQRRRKQEQQPLDDAAICQPKQTSGISLASDVTGVPLYTGQFSQPGHKEETKSKAPTSGGSKKPVSSSLSSPAHSAKKRRIDVPPEGDDPHGTTPPILSKKRAKKRAWKERQKQKRLDRLAEKKMKPKGDC